MSFRLRGRSEVAFVAVGTRKAGTHGDDPVIPPEEHLWWFHRTFRERAPGGLGRRSVRGLRSKDRPIGRKKGNARNDSGPHLLAIGLIAGGEIAAKADGEPNYYLAAQVAVLRCEGMDYLPDAFEMLVGKEMEEKTTEDDRAVLARVRLTHRALTAEHKRGLAGHIHWLRGQPAALAELKPLLSEIVDEERAKQ